MGNVRTEQVKRVAKELIRRFPDKFSANFEDNKHVVGKLVQGTTRKIRNQIAGYITRTIVLTQPASPNETPEGEGE